MWRLSLSISVLACGLLLAATPALPQPHDVAVQAVEGVRGDKLAVIVGVNEYKDAAVRDLSYAAQDARAVYEVLTDPQRGAFEPGNVHLLTDDSPADHQPTRVNILRWLNVACQLAEAQDTVLFYFGGHGIPDYLLAQDTQLTLPQDTVRTARVQGDTRCLQGAPAGGGLRLPSFWWGARGRHGGEHDGVFTGGSALQRRRGVVLLPVATVYRMAERGHVGVHRVSTGGTGPGDTNGDGVVTVTEAGSTSCRA